jgi:nucleotide-binding universal stress UspA family protein
MDALRNILVLMDPGAESQPAFDAALTLARRFSARLELLMVDYQDLHAAYFSPPTATLQEFHDSVMASHHHVLERYSKRAADAGVRLVDETPKIGAGGKRIAFLHPKSTHGVMVELCEEGAGPGNADS